MANGGGDGRTDGRMEIHPCVLQDIGPLGPLPKKGRMRKGKKVNMRDKGLKIRRDKKMEDDGWGGGNK